MACGCNKNKGITRSGPALRPGVYNRSAKQGNITGPIKFKNTPAPKSSNSAVRKLQSERREAIRKGLGKP